LSSIRKKPKSDYDDGKVPGGAGAAFEPSLSSRNRSAGGGNAQALQELKKSWRELYLTQESRNGVLTEEHKTLALASVIQLGCGVELFLLMGFVNVEGMPGAQFMLEEAAKNLLQDKVAASELRNSLVESIRRMKHPSIEKLCFFSGVGCDRDDLGEFLSKIEEPTMRKNAELGWGFRLAGNDFSAGLEYTLGVLGHPASSIFDDQILVDLMGFVSNRNDHKRVYETIESSDVKVDKRRSQIELVRHWASERPEEVSQYLMKSNADTSYISVVSEVYLQGNPVDAVEWVQDLPAGKYRDSAILAQIINLTNDTIDVAPQLAEFVDNPEIKKKCFELIDQVNRGPESK